jgi:hypothetical protein
MRLWDSIPLLCKKKKKKSVKKFKIVGTGGVAHVVRVPA